MKRQPRKKNERAAPRRSSPTLTCNRRGSRIYLPLLGEQHGKTSAPGNFDWCDIAERSANILAQRKQLAAATAAALSVLLHQFMQSRQARERIRPREFLFAIIMRRRACNRFHIPADDDDDDGFPREVWEISWTVIASHAGRCAPSGEPRTFGITLGNTNSCSGSITFKVENCYSRGCSADSHRARWRRFGYAHPITDWNLQTLSALGNL